MTHPSIREGDRYKELKQKKEYYTAEQLNKMVLTREERDEADKLLKDPDLLKILVEEIQKQGIIGEEDTILVLINKINLRNCINIAPTSSNMVVSDLSGGGKDALTGTVTKFMVPEHELIHRTSLSPKALEYWGEGKDIEGFTWNGKVLYLEDPPEDLLKCQTFKVMFSGGTESTTVRDQRAVHLHIPGKPVFIITSYQASINYEGGRRCDAVRVDLSPTLTKKVIEHKLLKASGKNKCPDNPILSRAIKQIQPKEVVIPFAEELLEHIPEDLVMRTVIDNLLDYIKSSAVLHQHQRDIDDKGRIIANFFDYDYGKFVFLNVGDGAPPLNKDEEELVNILKNSPTPLSIKEVSQRLTKRTKKWVYDNLEDWKQKGIILDISVWNKKANKEITKIITPLGCSSINLPEISVFTGFHPQSENQNKEGFHGFHGFTQILRHLDENRQKNGLTSRFCENGENHKTSLLEVLTNDEKTGENHFGLNDDIKQAIQITLDKPEDNFEDVEKVLGNTGLLKLITNGTFIETSLGRTLRWKGA